MKNLTANPFPRGKGDRNVRALGLDNRGVEPDAYDLTRAVGATSPDGRGKEPEIRNLNFGF